MILLNYYFIDNNQIILFFHSHVTQPRARLRSSGASGVADAADVKRVLTSEHGRTSTGSTDERQGRCCAANIVSKQARAIKYLVN